MGEEDRSSEEQPDQPEPEGIEVGRLPDATDVSLTPFAAARGAMFLVWFILAGIALISLACFIYQFWYRLENGDHFVGTPVRWPTLVGHLIRGVGLALVCWRLSQYLASTAPGTNEQAVHLPERNRVFWKTLAWVLLILSAYAVFQVAYLEIQDRAEKERLRFFRPEFQSGRVSFRKDRIEFRRGFTEPKAGFQLMQIGESKEHLFVAAEAEITGRDIANATIEIGEIFPGTQEVCLHVKFTDGGANKMEKLTRDQRTRSLAVLIDGKLRAAPRVFSIISTDAMISNVLKLDEAARIIENGGDR